MQIHYPSRIRDHRPRRSAAIPGAAGTMCLLFSWLCCTMMVVGDELASFDTLGAEYKRDIRPLVKRFCLECHSSSQKEGELDLEDFATLTDVRRRTGVWLKVVEMLENGEMPPEDSPQPSQRDQDRLLDWVERYLHTEALAGAGDPGPVVLRRLTNAEYTWTIRDLTGVYLSPAREFPAEGAAGEGFTNTGNALIMSPGLLRKYLDAGKTIAAHAVLLPDGFRFSPHTTRRDRTDESLAGIRGFYDDFSVTEKLADHYGYGMSHLGNAGRIPLEQYFAATLEERDSVITGERTIEEVAAEHDLNTKYLSRLWTRLTDDDLSPLLDDLRSRWRSATPGDAETLAACVVDWQKGLWTFNPVGLLGRKGSRSRWMEPVSPLMQVCELRLAIPAPKDGEDPQDCVVSLIAGDAGDGNEHDLVEWSQPRLVAEDQPDTLLHDWISAGGQVIDANSVCVRAPSVITFRVPASLAGRELITTVSFRLDAGQEGSVQADVIEGVPDAAPGLLPSEVTVGFEHINIGADKRSVFWRRPILVADQSEARERFQAAMNDFRSLFPMAICYTQIVPVDELLTLTLLYREDDHLARLMLDEEQTARLDRLWDELRYVSHEPIRLVDVLDSLLETTIDHPQTGIFDDTVEAVNERATAFREQLVNSEVQHLDALVEFAARAWRRPISDREKEELRELYRQLRTLELPHEEAFRLTLARVFMAAPFLYRLEQAPEAAEPGAVTDYELASRLSYFLWSSMPDEELQTAAEAGQLTRSHRQGAASSAEEDSLGAGNELLRQTRRMLRDARVRRLATEFACQWLHIHEFDPHEQKSDTYFPEFAELRGDMYEESILFFTDLFHRDGSLLSLLSADHTFVNDRLAEFYGIPPGNGPESVDAGVASLLLNEGWRHVDSVRQHGRGGILGFATTLAKQSGTTRTSPILRGNWISEVLLGEKLPRPPKNVPQLADTVPDGLTERELIERHSSDAACAKCHARIDPFGFALEEFDAIGRRREKNRGGQSIDTQTTLPDGTQVEGLSGLRDYLLTKRRDTFLRQFCRKLLGYALGREVQLSDEPLLDEIMVRLEKNNYRFSVVVETIVLSEQFRMIRGSHTTGH